MNRPSIDATNSEIVQAAKDWVSIAAEDGFEAALRLIDIRDSEPQWSCELFKQLTFNHFDDDQDCIITDPKLIPDLRVEAYEFDDGTGFHVDHDLPLNNQLSDFTAQFKFLKTSEGYNIYLSDIHIL